jgi:hypothetical protein
MTPLKILKLITGEEIIGIVQDGREHPQNNEDGLSTDNLVFVTNPLKLNSSYDIQTKTHSVYLTIWVPSISDETIVIDKRQILTLGHPTEDLENHYYELLVISSLDTPKGERIKEDKSKDKDVKPNPKKDYKKMLKDHDFEDDDLN